MSSWSKFPPSQYPHFEATASILQVRGSPFGVIVIDAAAHNNGGVELLEFNTKRWWTVASLPQSLLQGGFASTPVGDSVFVVGGFYQERLAMDNVHAFTFGSTEWTPMPPLTTPRCYPAAVSVPVSDHDGGGGGGESMAVVLGGRNAFFQELNSVEYYDQTTNSWHAMPSFVTPRMAPAAVVLPAAAATPGDDDGEDVTTTKTTTKPQIVLVGGYNGSEWTTSLEILKVTDAVIGQEQDDIDSDDGGNEYWSSTTIPAMPIPVSFPQAVLIPDDNTTTTTTTPNTTNGDGENQQQQQQSGFLLVTGTSLLYDMDDDTFTVIQSYNFKTKTWALLLSTPRSKNVPREGCSLAYFKHVIYAIGGKEKNNNDKQRQQSQNNNNNNHLDAFNSSKKVLQWKIDNPASQMQDGIFDTASSKNPGSRSVTSSSRQHRHNHNHNHGSSSNKKKHHRHKSNTSQEASGGGGGGDEEGSHNNDHKNPSFIERSDRSQNVPPAINVQNNPGSIADMESLYSNYNDQSVKSVISQMPTRPPEEEIATHRTQNLPYMDYHGISGTYTGEVAAATSKPHGKGQLKWETTGDVYDGEWKHGSRYGYGRMTYAIGDVFEGWFKHDVKEGRGTYQWRDGKQYEGLYVDDKAEDRNGSLSWKNGTLFVGNFSRGQRTGKGVIRFPTNVRYQGDFVRGKYEGFGTCTFQDGRVYTGQWRKGKAHGKGKLTEADGTVLHDGDWANDEPVLE